MRPLEPCLIFTWMEAAAGSVWRKALPSSILDQDRTKSMRRTHLIADLVIETSEKWVGGELSFAEMALAHLADRLVREPRIATVDAPSRGLATVSSRL